MSENFTINHAKLAHQSHSCHLYAHMDEGAQPSSASSNACAAEHTSAVANTRSAFARTFILLMLDAP